MQQFASKHVPLIGFHPLSMQFENQPRENTLRLGSEFPPVFSAMARRGLAFQKQRLGFWSQAVLHYMFHLCSNKYTVHTGLISDISSSLLTPHI